MGPTLTSNKKKDHVRKSCYMNLFTKNSFGLVQSYLFLAL